MTVVTPSAPMQQAPRELVWKIVDGEVLILDVGTGDYFSLSPVGTDMWTRLQEGQSHEDIIVALSSCYGVDEATVTTDLNELVEQLRDARLLR
jgi:hypothetical protein